MSHEAATLGVTVALHDTRGRREQLTDKELRKRKLTHKERRQYRRLARAELGIKKVPK